MFIIFWPQDYTLIARKLHYEIQIVIHTPKFFYVNMPIAWKYTGIRILAESTTYFFLHFSDG